MDQTQRQITVIVQERYQLVKSKPKKNYRLLIVIFVLLLLVLSLSVISSSKRNNILDNQPSQEKNQETPPSNQEINQLQIQNDVKKIQKNVKQQPSEQTISPKDITTNIAQGRIPLFNFDTAIQKKKQFIRRIETSMTHYQCLEIQPLFHFFDYAGMQKQNFMMYFQTYYQNLIPAWDSQNSNKWSANRVNINLWNKDRFVTQWALYSVGEKDKVLYYREGFYNIPEIVMLSKIIGPAGKLTILQTFEGQGLVKNTLSLGHEADNIQYVSLGNMKSFEQFTAIIAIQQLFTKFNYNINPLTKLLIQSKDGEKLRKNTIFKPFKISKFILTDNSCGKGIFQDDLVPQGFYSINSFEQKRKLLQKPPYRNSVFGNLQSQYVQFKNNFKKQLSSQVQLLQSYKNSSLCIDPSFNRALSQFVYTIYGHKLFDVKLEQLLQWQEERQAIQWFRSHNKPKFDVYYEINDKNNLLAIVEIAIMIGQQGKMLVVCKQTNDCDRIKKQVDKNRLKNIKLLTETSSSEALLTQIVITDNQKLIKTCLQNKFLLNGSLLGYFTSMRNESAETIKQLNVHYQLKQVATPSSKTECAGFSYLNFFWNWETLNRFYEIKPSKYVIYTFWGGSPKKLNNKKKFIIEQLSNLDVQIKFVSPQLFLYFQIPGQPINPAFYLLTSIQKSDYFRVYIMHKYGGAYADVKHSHFKWKPYFEQLEKDQSKYAYGYAQIKDYDVACYDSAPPSCHQIKSNYYRLFGNCFYIFKKQTPLTTDWFNAVTSNLNNKYQDLKKNPPRVPRQQNGKQFKQKNGTTFISKYPFRWAEIANQHLARSQFKYINNVKAHMPFVLTIDYRTSSYLDQN